MFNQHKGGITLYIVLTHFVGAAGGLFAKKYKIPAGAMIGAMILVVLLNTVVGEAAAYPVNLRVIVQICSGIVIGCRFTRKDLTELRIMLKPVIILVFMLFALNVFFALLISHMTSLSMITSLFACAPGGVSDLALVAVEFGANTEQVTLLQLFRFIFVVSFFPPIMKKYFLKNESNGEKNHVLHKEPEKTELTTTQKIMRTVFSICAAGAGGLFFRTLGMPAGAIIGAIIATVATNLVTEKVYFPVRMKVVTQIFAGCYIGSQVDRESILSVGGLVAPMLFLLAEVFFMAFLTSFMINRITKLDSATSLFSCIPGGIAEMGLIAEEMGLDTPKIVLMHTCRVIAVICVMPLIIKIFTG